MSTPALLRLAAAVIPVVYKDEPGGAEPYLGRVVGIDYDVARYPEIDPILDALQTHDWHHTWHRDDLAVLHHCKGNEFAVLEESSYVWPAHDLIRIVLEAGGTLTPAPQL